MEKSIVGEPQEKPDRIPSAQPSDRLPFHDELFSLLQSGDQAVRANPPERANLNQTEASKNPADHLSAAATYASTLKQIERLHPDDLIQDHSTNLPGTRTVGELRRELTKAAELEFGEAIRCANNIDLVKAASLIGAIEERLNNGAPAQLQLKLDTHKVATDETTRTAESLDRMSRAQLELLRTMTIELCRLPLVSAAQAASFCLDVGQSDKADKFITEAKRAHPSASNDEYFARIENQIGINSRLKVLTNGANPLDTLQEAYRERMAGASKTAASLYEKAMLQAANLDQKTIRQRLKDLQKEEANTAPFSPQRSHIKDERDRLEELVHAKAIAQSDSAAFEISQGKFDDALKLLDLNFDRKFIAQHPLMYLQLVASAKSGGKIGSLFESEEHLQAFQRSLDPEHFDLSRARSELDAAFRCNAHLPLISRELIDVLEFQQSQGYRLARDRQREKDPERRDSLVQKSKEVDETIRSLKLLRDLPPRAELTEAVFLIASKDFSKAEKVLNSMTATSVGQSGWEFVWEHREAIYNLREIAANPVKLQGEEATWKRLCKEALCDVAAIGAGAGTVALTSWTGPGALVAGGAAGAAGYTGMKYLLNGEVSWTDPLWGTLDGISGGTSLMARRLALKSLSEGAATVAAERAAAAAGVDMAALEGTSSTRLVFETERLARQSLKEMGGEPLWTASRAVGRLGLLNARNLWLSDMAGVAAGSSLYRGAQVTQRLASGGFDNVNGQYTTGQEKLNAAFGTFNRNVALDTLTGGVAGQLGRVFPTISGRLSIAAKNVSPFAIPILSRDVHDYAKQLVEVRSVLSTLLKPPSPEELRSTYLELQPTPVRASER